MATNVLRLNFGFLRRSCFNSASSVCSSSRDRVVLHHFGRWSVFGEHILATTKRIVRNGRVGQLLGRPVARLWLGFSCKFFSTVSRSGRMFQTVYLNSFPGHRQFEECSSQNGEPLATIEEEGFALHYDGSIHDATCDGAGLYLRISFVRMQLALILILNQKFGTCGAASLQIDCTSEFCVCFAEYLYES